MGLPFMHTKAAVWHSRLGVLTDIPVWPSIGGAEILIMPMPFQQRIPELARVFLPVAALLPVLVLGMHFRSGEDPLSPFAWDPDMTSLQINAANKQAQIVLLGDSLVARWSFRQKLWNELCQPANLGVGGLNAASLLWLVRSGKLAAFHPKHWVIMIGSNDIGVEPPKFWQPRRPSPERIAQGVAEVVKTLKAQDPESHVLVTALPSRRGAMEQLVVETNQALRAQGLDVVDPWRNDSVLSGDDLHLSDAGYEEWAQSLAQLTQCAPEYAARER
jgi:lysophospholipase L1-like esterase